MATLNQIAERIAYALNDSFNVELLENIKFSVLSWRAMLIRQDIERNGLSDEFLQKAYIDLVKVDAADSCDFTIDNCIILKSVNKIPKLVRMKSDVLFKFVGIFDENSNLKPTTYVEQEELRYRKFNRYTSKTIAYNYTNDYLYFFNNTKLKKATIQAIFADPRQVNLLCSENCFDSDSELPIGMDMLNTIVAGIISKEFPLQNPTDAEVNINTDR